MTHNKQEQDDELSDDEVYLVNKYIDNAIKQEHERILRWCHKNNTIPINGTSWKLATTDGGWINVIALKKFLEDNSS